MYQSPPTFWICGCWFNVRTAEDTECSLIRQSFSTWVAGAICVWSDQTYFLSWQKWAPSGHYHSTEQLFSGGIIHVVGCLCLDALKYVLIDWSRRDMKQRRIIDMRETRTDLMELLQKYLIPHIKVSNSAKFALFWIWHSVTENLILVLWTALLWSALFRKFDAVYHANYDNSQYFSFYVLILYSLSNKHRIFSKCHVLRLIMINMIYRNFKDV